MGGASMETVQTQNALGLFPNRLSVFHPNGLGRAFPLTAATANAIVAHGKVAGFPAMAIEGIDGLCNQFWRPSF